MSLSSKGALQHTSLMSRLTCLTRHSTFYRLSQARLQLLFKGFREAPHCNKCPRFTMTGPDKESTSCPAMLVSPL